MRLNESPAADVVRYILVVEDDPAHAEAIKRAFQSAGLKTEVQVVGTLREYRQRVAVCTPDIAIMDLKLPDGRAVEVLTSPPESGLFPIVVMTNYGNEQTAVAAIKAGALDYVVKGPGVFADMPHIVERVRREWDLLQKRKQAEEERKNLTEQLVRAEKLAAVGELISGVAHEINNPLAGIIGLSELLLRENKNNLDENTKKDLESIYQSSERIRKIVANLLRFSRREAPMRKNISINELIDAVLVIRSYEMKVRNVKVVRHYQPDLPLVMADASQLEQVFLNLMSNAEYAIHESGKAGTLTIAIFSQEEQPKHKKVIIEISDTGAGIPEKVFSKLFNPFFTTKPVGKGTGLGLSVSYGIIKEHGGEIYARNRVGGGAVFTIELPVGGGK